MKARLASAVEHKTPVSLSTGDLVMVKTELARDDDYRQPLHREASIQDVLACLLDQQPPSARMMSSQNAGGSFLVHSENAKQEADYKPSLKKLLSSNDFSMTEKKESLRHLLSFIDTSFASNTPEPLTQVYKDCEAGTLQRLSSLQLMRNFMSPNSQQNAGTATDSGMGMRTTSFEIIQAMLNATSNQALQKPMTSQDSFRFQHLARTLESIETDVSAIDNDDYGGDDVVQVDNLDHLLDYHGSNSSNMSATTTTTSTQGQSVGFVDTQTLVNPSRNIYTENSPSTSNMSTFMTYTQPINNHQDYNPTVSTPANLPTMGMIHHMSSLSYQEQQQQQNLLQQQLLRQEQQQKQQQQYNQLYQNAVLHQQQQNGLMLSTPGYAGANPPMPQFPNMLMKPGAAMLCQKPQHLRSGSLTQQMRIATQNGKSVKTDVNGTQLCSALGCNHAARVKGMCKLHGGGRRCKVEGCMKSAQTGHLCIAHGGGKPCNVEGCPKTAQSRGLCKQHGGGVRCKYEGCTKSCQSGGFCRGHGGGKRCEFPNCTKWAQKNGHCAKHAQEIAAQQLQQQQAIQAQMYQQLVHP
ncbi:uncharacterized protein PHALS_10454 [Plasmopara halstedii]|uniref:WRKY19-like zinc finger domain-containing protein n=1 Tax=Plasmopara halstedii TaxID=4781 RepID=A0A0P1AH80_PLAHL|nr:uncharacterized protein PHALS_10454 [Plasmopara halstedii]CEG40242.1 hypothetical protein PHALS_10454 [Plasmopara halstedii]|eukprot:XP_024576611.1 hypothetical protein PHALS_10454 [Plasmopara halstedii]